jgi:ribosomal protein S18 acetylase RimI-like enzyme
MDGSVFPCLADREGCRQLMRDIATKNAFVSESTWLAVEQPGTPWETALGTIQGLRTSPIQGAIQNIGVIPNARGRGIGRELIRRALLGFHAAGCRNVTLEVTIHNLAAICLYRSVGFVRFETVFKYGNVPVQ